MMKWSRKSPLLVLKLMNYFDDFQNEYLSAKTNYTCEDFQGKWHDHKLTADQPDKNSFIQIQHEKKFKITNVTRLIPVEPDLRLLMCVISYPLWFIVNNQHVDSFWYNCASRQDKTTTNNDASSKKKQTNKQNHQKQNGFCDQHLWSSFTFQTIFTHVPSSHANFLEQKAEVFT